VAAMHPTWCTAPWVIYYLKCMVSPNPYMVKGDNIENICIMFMY
jgi:hypothetical protein